MKNLSLIEVMDLYDRYGYDLINRKGLYFHKKPLSNYITNDKSETLRNFINEKELNYKELIYIIDKYKELKLHKYRNKYFGGYPLLLHYQDKDYVEKLINAGINYNCPRFDKIERSYYVSFMDHIENREFELDKDCLYEGLKHKRNQEIFIEALEDNGIEIKPGNMATEDFLQDILKENRFKRLFAYMYKDKNRYSRLKPEILLKMGLKAVNINDKMEDKKLKRDLLDIERKTKEAIKRGYFEELLSILPDIKKVYPYAGYLIEFYLDKMEYSKNILSHIPSDISRYIGGF